MAARRSTHVILAVAAAVLLLVGIFAVVRAGTGDSPDTAPQGAASDGRTGSGATADTSGGPTGGGAGGNGGPGGSGGAATGGPGGGSGGPGGGSGVAHIPGPTLDNVYPVNGGLDGLNPGGGCIVLVNDGADIPVRIQALQLRGADRLSLSGEPCTVSASEAALLGSGLTDPITTCAAGTVLQPASRRPYNGCSLNVVDPTSLGETAALHTEVVAQCTSRTPRPCSRLGSQYAPSAGHTVTTVVTRDVPITVKGNTPPSGTETTQPPTTEPPPPPPPPTTQPPTEPTPEVTPTGALFASRAGA